MRCPCRKKSESITYADCCEPFHVGPRLPSTAEALMRSRYAAFALESAAYLSATWHASTRPRVIEFTPGQEWLALRVIATRTTGHKATVEFVARSRIGGDTHALHEVSRFVREHGQWFYVDGDVQ